MADPGPRDALDDMRASDMDEPAPTAPGRTTDSSSLPCPYCGETNELFLEPDPDRGEQEFAEKCEVCGRTYTVSIAYDAAGEPSIHAERPE